MFYFSRVVVLYIHFIPENMVSLVLVRRYGAHAMASHAQDCPDQKLERPTFPWSSSISLFLLQESLSPVLVGCYSAHAMALHAQDCPDWKLERTNPLIFPIVTIKMYLS